MNNERLSSLHVTTRKDLVNATFQVSTCFDVAKGIVFHLEVVKQSFVLRVHEAHCEEHDVGWYCELGTWNLYHAHRLWVDDPDNQLAGSGSREPLSFTLAPSMVKIAFGLAIVITVSTFLCRPVEKPKPTPTERYAEWVEENLDRHVLSEGVELYDDQVGIAFYRHHVEPGSYILDIYKSNTTDTIVLTRLARNVKQNSSENQLVYLFGNRVYRLHTQSEVALQDLGYDLLEEVKGDCLQNWGRRRCGWLVE